MGYPKGSWKNWDNPIGLSLIAYRIQLPLFPGSFYDPPENNGLNFYPARLLFLRCFLIFFQILR